MTEEKPHYIGHRKRLREKFLKLVGSASTKDLPDYEILEMILFSNSIRSDVKPLAKTLITKFGNLAKVMSAEIDELLSVENLNESGICAIKLMYESSIRLLNQQIKNKTVLQSWGSLLDYCRACMSNNKTEQLRIFFLDKKNMLIADELQQKGTVDHTPVYPREVVKRALELGASSLILVHNHPTGDPTPSKADINMTKQIVQAAAALSINIHDHLIIGGNNKYYSFAANGLI